MKLVRESVPVILAIILLGIVAPWYLSAFRISLLGRWLTWAILAIGIDLIWGYAGLLSLGHGVFWGIGAYCMAMHLKLEAVGKGSIPDFMGWSGISHLPWWWELFRSPTVAIGFAIILPMVLAAVIGYFTFRFRIRGVYFSILTIALALVLEITLVSQQPFTGGSNGISDFKTIFGYSVWNPTVNWVLYFTSLAVLVLVYIAARWLTQSRMGRVLMAIRDQEQRVSLCGYNPLLFKLFVFVVSAGLAALAGVLFVPQVGIVTPSMVGVVPSIEMVVWVAVGGRGTLLGAPIGALAVNGASSYFSEMFPSIWNYFFGALFIVTILLFPGGLVGLGRETISWGKRLYGRVRDLAREES